MRFTSLSRLFTLAVCAVLAACADSRTSGPTSALQTVAAPSTSGSTLANAAVCAPGTFAELVDAANLAFGARTPGAQSVIAQLNKLDVVVGLQNQSAARTQAIGIIQFTLAENARGVLPGGTFAVIAFVNAVACFAGLDLSISTLDNFFFIQPTDGPQTLRTVDGFAGIALQANPVFEPTLLHIEPIPLSTDAPGAGPLRTKLDQYRGFYRFDIASASNGKLLARPAVVGLCAPSSIEQVIFDRLRLGHEPAAGFRIEPSADVDFLTCDAFGSARPTLEERGFLGRVASLFTPRTAFAATATNTTFYGGGVGGTLIELSPFALIDPVVSMSGGVGGTLIELQERVPEPAAEHCASIEAPIGTGLPVDCRPQVQVRTFLGTLLENVPVTFSIIAGDGAVARETADSSCVTPFSTVGVVVPTNERGIARACWTMGARRGTNRLRAIAAIGGDAPPGVTYRNGIEFVAIATAPARVEITAAPDAGNTLTVIPPTGGRNANASASLGRTSQRSARPSTTRRRT